MEVHLQIYMLVVTQGNTDRAKATPKPKERPGAPEPYPRMVLGVLIPCLGLGFGVWGLGFGVWGLGFGVWGLGFGV